MNLLNDFLIRDTAKVTGNGILLSGKFYTCSVALREQWFYKAQVEEWSVHVYFDPSDIDYILIQLQNGFLCIGNLVMNEALKRDTKDYYILIEQLKNRIKNRRGRNK